MTGRVSLAKRYFPIIFFLLVMAELQWYMARAVS